MFCVSICNVISMSLWGLCENAEWQHALLLGHLLEGADIKYPFHFTCLSIVVGTHSKKLNFPVLVCISADHFCKQPRWWQHRVVEADLGWLCKIRGKTTCVNFTKICELYWFHSFQFNFQSIMCCGVLRKDSLYNQCFHNLSNSLFRF